MAQRDKEEAELRVPETLALCINNCGFHGNPATKNMCQSCFQASGHDGPSPPPSCSGHEKARSAPFRSPGRSEAGREGTVVARAEPAPAEAALVAETAMAPLRRMNRCAGCRKRVGLTGFRCRCGDLFCAEHRYSERHVCSYDYKAAGREAIARENPVVRAAKIVRI